MGGLIQEYGLEVVTAYMGHIMHAAEEAVRDMLVTFSLRKGMGEIGQVHAEDQMDDGTPICLTLSIDRITRTAEFDFTGTGPEVGSLC
jgi:5-oxoprolinase (ATP-hydrolysing)